MKILKILKIIRSCKQIYGPWIVSLGKKSNTTTIVSDRRRIWSNHIFLFHTFVKQTFERSLGLIFNFPPKMSGILDPRIPSFRNSERGLAVMAWNIVKVMWNPLLLRKKTYSLIHQLAPQLTLCSSSLNSRDGYWIWVWMSQEYPYSQQEGVHGNGNSCIGNISWNVFFKLKPHLVCKGKDTFCFNSGAT